MLTKIISLSRALSMCAVSLVLAMCIACPAPVKEDPQVFNGRILAENSTMKKRLPLVERENDVLKKENLQQRMKVLDQESQIKQLGLELTSLNDKYTKDMTASAEQINKLQETIQKIEQESSARIQGLMAMNAALEAKMAREVQDLKKLMAKQNDAHIQERKQIMQKNAQREFDLTAQLDNLKKALDAKDLEITSRKMAMNEISSKLREATTLSESLKKDRDAAAAELESAKAANADLVKKVDALSKQLSTDKSEPSNSKQLSTDKSEPSNSKQLSTDKSEPSKN
jgi:chromosome segregation ATPase